MNAIRFSVAPIVITATLASAQAPPIVVALQPQAVVTAIDRQEISRLLDASPKPTWLLTTARGQTGVWMVQAFSEPDAQRDNLRRGRMTALSGALSPADRSANNLAGPKSWSIGATFEYAQVVIPNRTFQDVRGPNDPNLPFRNSSTLTDDELVSLVTFLRTSPGGPEHAPDRVNRDSTGRPVIRDARGATIVAEPCSPGDFPIDRVCGELPIRSIVGKDSDVTVSISLAVMKGQIVRLGRDGTSWRIIGITVGLG